MTTQPKITGYRIAETRSSILLAQKVEELMAEGWVPHGPVVFSAIRREDIRVDVELWAQPLVKFAN